MARTWTTPTVGVTLETDAELAGCSTYCTIRQGALKLTSEVDIEPTEGGYRYEVPLTQVQSGGFKPSLPIELQTNVVDSNGYRAAANISEFRMGRNLEDKEL